MGDAQMASVGFESLLTGAGYRIRGRRADCPHCEGTSRRTVSIGNGVAFCHRCQRSVHARGLAREQGKPLRAWNPGRAHFRKRAFERWLDAKCAEMANREYFAHRRAMLSRERMPIFEPYGYNHEAAWDDLAAYYDQEHTFRIFWESASDKIGRYFLYRAWRAASA